MSINLEHTRFSNVTNGKRYPVIKAYLSSVKDNKHFAQDVTRKMEHLKSTHNTNDNGFWGDAFEFIFLDSLIKQGIPDINIERKVHIPPRLHAEADIYVPACKTAFLLKTSFRERWKQPDRDAHIIVQQPKSIIPYLIFFRENNDATQESIDSQAKKIKGMLLSKAEVISVYHFDTLNKIVWSMVCQFIV